jgi:hypothetical protein
MSFAAILERLTNLENPYPGLRRFDTSEAHLFFGRDQQILDVIDRLARSHFVAVLGLSGSGKSSLIRAGLMPALYRSRLLEPELRWRAVVAQPAGDPFANLAGALGCALADLRASSHGLIDYARSSLGKNEGLLVVVDQFEELFRYKDRRIAPALESASQEAQSSEAAAFVELLLAATRGPLPVYVVITMRTDYLGDCAEFPDFPETLNESQYLVPRLTREQRRQAIEGPLGGARIPFALVERILNDAGGEPDQLPILQHALIRTWSHWREASSSGERPIGMEDYEAAGGFAGALNQHANELLNSGAARAEPWMVEIVFKRLTAISRGRERRDPAPLSELWELCNAESEEQRQRVNAVIDVFRTGEATFLTPRDGVLKPDAYIDITHESLIRNWKILAEKWLPDEERQAKTFTELLDRARGWQAGTREVLRGLDLAAALEWDSRRNRSTRWAEHYTNDAGAIGKVEAFLSASREEFERSERQKAQQQAAELRAQAERASARRTRNFSYVLVVLLIVTLVLAVFARNQQMLAESRRRVGEEAYANEVRARAQAEAERKRAEAAVAMIRSSLLIRQAALSGDETGLNNLLASLGRNNSIRFDARATDLRYKNPSNQEVYNFDLYPVPNTLPTGANAVAFITYLANHPTFRNTLMTAGPNRQFHASYIGWGCLIRIVALVEYKDPITPPTVTEFNMCESLGWQ